MPKSVAPDHNKLTWLGPIPRLWPHLSHVDYENPNPACAASVPIVMVFRLPGLCATKTLL